MEISVFFSWICGFVLCVVNDAILVNSQRGGSNQTSRITDRDGKGSIFSASKAVCVERKWVHSASMMLITRLHVSPVLAFLQAGNWQSDWIYCFMSRLKSRKETWAGAWSKSMYVEIMKHYKMDHIQMFRRQTHWFDAIFVVYSAKICPFKSSLKASLILMFFVPDMAKLPECQLVDPHKVYQEKNW